MRRSESELKKAVAEAHKTASWVIVAFGLMSSAACGPAPAGKAEAVDFDVALEGLNFEVTTLDANLDHGQSGDGILDADQLALVAYVLNHSDIDLSTNGGVSSVRAREAFGQAMASAKVDLAQLNMAYPSAAEVVAGYAMLGQDSLESMGAMTAAFGAPLKQEYSLATAMEQYFSADGDADGDGISNGDEYRAKLGQGRNAFIAGALDASDTNAAPETSSSDEATKPPPVTSVGIVLYPGFELLDVFGPAEMWANVPDMNVIMVAEVAGPVPSAQQGVSTMASISFNEAPQFDVIMVPGGTGTYQQLENKVFLDFLRKQDESTQFTTSVCTGSALLAKAGLLANRKATSNKAYFSLAVSQDSSVDWQKSARWVEDGKYFTSSGVSAGTDMALGLIAKFKGKTNAANLARSLEYVWNQNPDEDPFALE